MSTATASESQHPVVGFNGYDDLGVLGADQLSLLRSLALTAYDFATSSNSAPGSRTVDSGSTTTLPRQDSVVAKDVASSKRRSMRLLDVANPVIPSGVVQGMEKWDAVVVEIQSDFFTAELRPQGAGGAALEVDFPISAVSPEDLDLLKVGAAFYVTVRTVLDMHSRAARTSALRFRRLGVWTQEELEGVSTRSRERARRLSGAID